MWLSANLGCRSETCCTWLVANTRRKNRHLDTIAQLCRAISSQLRYVSTIGKNLLNSNTSSGPLAAEIGSGVWGTLANFDVFRVLATLLHSTLVVGVSQTLRHWTEGATYNRQGGITLGIGPHSSWYRFHRLNATNSDKYWNELKSWTPTSRNHELVSSCHDPPTSS